MTRLLLLFLLSLLCACTADSDSPKKQIEGVWMYYYHAEDEAKGPGIPQPLLFDFTSSGELTILRHGESESMEWSMISDSTFSIEQDTLRDTLEILFIDQDSLIVKYTGTSTRHQYVRPLETQLDHTLEDINEILTSKFWHISDTADRRYKYQRRNEYLKPELMLIQYRRPDLRRYWGADMDTIEGISKDIWKVFEYKEAFYLSHDGRLASGQKTITQIVDISSDTLKVYEWNRYGDTEMRIVSYNGTTIESNLNRENIIGKWRSRNSKDKSYGRPNKGAVKRGDILLYEGDVFLSVEKKQISISMDSIIYGPLPWIINKDGSAIIGKEYYPEIDFSSYWLSQILNISADSMQLRMYYNTYNTGYTGRERPWQYTINVEQNFVRIE